MQKNMRKNSKNNEKSSKIPPKINPGGLRNPLACQVGARRLPKSLPEASGSEKNNFRRGQEAPKTILDDFWTFPWVVGREQRGS